MPDLSVIVPARDAAATLGRTLAGLARQREAGDFEVVVVDDGSRGDTSALARRSEVVDVLLEGEGRGPALARISAPGGPRALTWPSWTPTASRPPPGSPRVPGRSPAPISCRDR